MMEIEIFRKSIMESDAILKSFGVNLYDNLMSDGNQFDSVENSITGIISVQVKPFLISYYFYKGKSN